MTEAMHERVPGSLVLWYDSVTMAGDLDWQNELNESNSPFFDVCDGIFLNYTWKVSSPAPSACCKNPPDDLSNSVDHLRSKKEPRRIHDVYVGVDVFGRGCFGGGGFNCSQAFDAIRYDLEGTLVQWNVKCNVTIAQ